MIGDKAAIAVLGSPRAGSPEKIRALGDAVGAELAGQGFAVVLEGVGDLSVAVASGVSRGGGRALAVVSPGADAAEKLGQVEVDTQPNGLRAIERVLELADAVLLVEPGLASASVLLQILLWSQTRDAPYRQTILVGDGWSALLGQIADALGLDRRARATVTFAQDPKEAVEALRYYVSGDTAAGG